MGDADFFLQFLESEKGSEMSHQLQCNDSAIAKSLGRIHSYARYEH